MVFHHCNCPFPLSIGPEPNLLARIAAGVVWVAALISALLSLERLFRDDFQDGALEQMMLLMPIPLQLVVLSKVIAHWLLTGLPLILITAIGGIALFGFRYLAVSCFNVIGRYASIELYWCDWCGFNGRASEGRCA